MQTAASYLVPWLAEGGGEEAPSEPVQRCTSFGGVGATRCPGSDRGGRPGRAKTRDGRSLAEEAEAMLEATIGAEATREILLAAEELDPANAAGDVDVAPEEDGPRARRRRRTTRARASTARRFSAGSMRALKVSGVERAKRCARRWRRLARRRGRERRGG